MRLDHGPALTFERCHATLRSLVDPNRQQRPGIARFPPVARPVGSETLAPKVSLLGFALYPLCPAVEGQICRAGKDSDWRKALKSLFLRSCSGLLLNRIERKKKGSVGHCHHHLAVPDNSRPVAGLQSRQITHQSVI